MPVPNLNNAATSAGYTDANTVEFPRGRKGFVLDIANAAIYYVLAYRMPDDREPSWLPNTSEVYKMPTVNSFMDVEQEGLPPGSLFGGVKVRSAISTTPARVTIG